MASNNVSKPARTSPPLRCSYPTLFNPKSFQAGQTPKFSITVMIDKTNKEQMDYLKALHKDATDAMAEKWPDPAKRPRINLIGDTKSLFKDGDKTVNNNGIPLNETNPEYAGHYLLRASTATRPAVVDRNKAEILDANEVYGGCFVKVNLNVYTFDTQANRGVTCGLNGVQKWADGESFGGGRPSLDQMFDGGGAAAAAGEDPFAGGGSGNDEGPF